MPNRRRARPLLTCAAVACALAGGAGRAGEGPVLLAGEIEALRAALDAELAATDYQRVTVGSFLRLPRDTREARERSLEALVASGLADEATVESFRNRNRERVELWQSTFEPLGERAERGVILFQSPRQVAVQYGRMGGSTSGARGLVYLELRPYERAQRVTAVFRAVERVDGRWRVLTGRVGFERDGFGTKALGE